LLGASYEEGLRENTHADIYSLQELESLFTLDKLNKAPAIFDYKKLEWFNGQYIRMKTDDELSDLCLPCAVEKGLFGTDGKEPSPEQKNLFTAAMPLIRERLTFIHEAAEKIAYLFSEPELPETAEFIPKKLDINETIKLLNLAKEFIPSLAAAPDDAVAEEYIKEQAEKNNVKLGDIMMPLRVTLTGSRVSPPLFGSIRLLGAEKSLQRVERVLHFLGK